jgi:hypothetical protein
MASITSAVYVAPSFLILDSIYLLTHLSIDLFASHNASTHGMASPSLHPTDGEKTGPRDLTAEAYWHESTTRPLMSPVFVSLAP